MRKALLVLLLVALPAMAGEGMWMPQQIPQLADELQKAGIKIDPARLADLTGDPMGAVISLGNCTASFVSPEGLAVTNHHCAYGSIQYNSTKERDLIRNGFLAKTKEEELRAAPGSAIYVTTKIEDVTDRVTGKLAAKLSDRDRAREISKREKALVAECEAQGGVRCRVSSFFEGEQYLRTTQMHIKDVRLVYAPAEGVGNYGGETDNWMWPRHTGDFAFYRAYVGKDGKPAEYSKDNVPYRPVHHLKVSTEGVNPGDFVMVAGYPGRTYRYKTSAEVAATYEFSMPTYVEYAKALTGILNELGKNDREREIRNASRIRGIENTMKNYTGVMNAFRTGYIQKQRSDREAALAQYAASNPKYAGVMDQLNKFTEREMATAKRDTLMVWIYRSSPLLTQARQIYRYSIEKEKKDIDRATGFQQRDVPTLMQASARVQAEIDVPSDRAGLRYFLLESQKLPAGQRISAIDEALAKTGVDGVEAQVERFLDALYSGTKLTDGEVRKAMYDQTKKQIDAGNDTMIAFASKLMPLTLAIEENTETLTGAASRIRPTYLSGLRAMSGGRLYPDANSTLRVTFGKVVGYSPKDGMAYTPQTTVEGIVAKHTGEGEFDTPDELLAAAGKREYGPYADPELGSVAVNFLSDVDTTGGNSGSPSLNAKGELNGLLFDGTFEGLGNDYLPGPLTRSITVDATYMLWVMDRVDRAHNLLREMGIQPKFQ